MDRTKFSGWNRKRESRGKECPKTRTLKKHSSLPKKQLLCIVTGLLLGIAAETSAGLEQPLKDGYILERKSYGQGEARYELAVEGLEPDEALLEVTIGEQMYTKEEAHQVYETILDELPSYILGENPSLTEVRKNLNLITSLGSYGIRLRWESEEPEILDSFGNVNGDGLGEEGRTIYLGVRMTDGHWPEEYLIEATVKPPMLSEPERKRTEFLELVKAEDERQITSGYMELPRDFQGKGLSYESRRESSFWPMAALGITGAVLLKAKDKNDKKQKDTRRRQQMMLDYSEVLSRLIIFLGAGMSIRTAWDKIAAEHQQMVAAGRRRPRHVYKEMFETSCQMKSGVSEGKAFSDFGRRCGMQHYMKLAGLLEQNRKNGSRNLRDTLKIEMAEAFEQRKHQARRLGEEAGTKLLLPLFMMLSVVMIMIAVPALMEFR